MSLNNDLAELFHSIAALMELRGENTFKVIAFQKVGRILRETSIDLKKCMEEGKLCEIQGIGKSSQQIIEEFISTGKSTVFQEISATVPAGLVPLLSIEGLGPKTIHMLWQERNITSLDALSKAIDTGTLQGLKGIGEKKLETIKKGIEVYKSRAADGGSGAVKRVGIGEVIPLAQTLLEGLRGIQGVTRAEVAGSFAAARKPSPMSTSLPPLAMHPWATPSARRSPICRGWCRRWCRAPAKQASKSPMACRRICGSSRKIISGRPCSISQAPRSTT